MLMTVGTRVTTLGQLGSSVHIENYSRFCYSRMEASLIRFPLPYSRVRNSMVNWNCRSSSTNLEKRRLPLLTVDHNYYQ